MHKLVLLRHGESTWNRENRFTGWTDVDLAPSGIEEARNAGRLLKSAGYEFDLAFTSLLKRAIRTLWLALEELDRMWLPVEKTWRLNERHYGDLQGLNKAEMAAKFGRSSTTIWAIPPSSSGASPPFRPRARPRSEPRTRRPRRLRGHRRRGGAGRARSHRAARAHRAPEPRARREGKRAA